MSWPVDEPGPDAAEDLERLAEEERRLAIVLEHEGRQQAGRRQQVPDDEDGDQQRELPEAQMLHGCRKLPTVANGLRSGRFVRRLRLFVGHRAGWSILKSRFGGVV